MKKSTVILCTIALIFLCAACGKSKAKKISDDEDESEKYEYVLSQADVDNPLDNETVDKFMDKLSEESSAGDLATGCAVLVKVAKMDGLPFEVIAQLEQHFNSFFRAGYKKDPELFEKVFKHYIKDEDFSQFKEGAMSEQTLVSYGEEEEAPEEEIVEPYYYDAAEVMVDSVAYAY
ncbi:MAG: hypothetical protein K2M79_06905 [Muribaculaceae bacterium]|nr:hypothetical protein [Muribaculaceae bacterium]